MNALEPEHQTKINKGKLMKTLLSSLIAASVSALMLLTPAAHADDLENIQKSGELRIAMSGVFAPFSSVDEKNEVVGFDVDISSELAKRIGVKPVVITTAWDGIIPGLRAGKFDTIVGSMSITPERLKAVDFAGPYYRGGRGIFVAEGSPIKTIEELQTKTIGIILGETSDKWAREKGGWTIRTYKGIPELLLELRSGRVDGIVTDDIPILIAIKNGNEKVRQLDIPELQGSDNVGIAIRKNNPELKAALNKALEDMKADGTYEKISMKWIGRDIR